MGLAYALLLLFATPPVAGASSSAAPTVENLVAGAEACATRKLSDTKMAERLATLGWQAREKLRPGKSMQMSTYVRMDVTIYYFTSPEMTQCIARGGMPANFDQAALVSALAAKLAKAPKTAEAGRRYLYFLPRLDILTLQFKSDDKDPHIEMSVVH